MKQENVAANSVRHDNIGISLISLIITIIVIIILAAIVIFSGLNTPDSASFAGFTQQVDNVYQAVMNKYGDLKAKHAIAGHYRTDEQIYIEIAVADDPDQYATMGTTSVTNFKSGTKIENSTGIQNIQVGAAMNKEHSIGMTLPKVRENNTAWYVTKEGKVFNANGYIYDGKTYFSGSLYQGNELSSNETSNSNRAYYIYEAIKKDINEVTGAPLEGTGEVIAGGNTNDNNGENENPSTTTHTVTFDVDGGSTVASQTITSGQTATRPSDPTREGYTFDNWYSDSEKTSVFDFSTLITGATTIYAKWNAVVATPTVALATGGDQNGNGQVDLGDEVTITSNGHTDNYYYVKQNGSKKVYLAKTSLSGNTSWAKYNSAGGPWAVNGRASDYPYDLNNDVENYGDVGEYHYNETNPYSRAKAYGAERHVTGRLLTKEEYDILKTSSNWSSIYPNDGSTSWWLGSADNTDYLYGVNYYTGSLNRSYAAFVNAVRPVIEF